MITPTEFVNDLNRISSMRDVRILILYIDLYIQYFLNAIYSKKVKKEKLKCENCDRYMETKFKDKIDKLSDMGIIWSKNKHNEVIKIIYELRCKLVHNLKPDMNLLEQKIQQHEPDIQEIIPSVSKYWKKTDPWVKIQLMALPPVVALYQEYEKTCGREPEETIRFLINPEYTMVRAEVIKK